MELKLEQISCSYDAQNVLKACSLHLRAGEVLVVSGKPGAGKSTLLRSAATLRRPQGGRVLIDGCDVWALSDLDQLDLRARIGVFFQEAALVANMTVFNNLALPLRYRGMRSESAIARDIEGWLERMELIRYRDRLPAALSLGQKRAVAFIRIMMVDASLLLWDEPSQGASPELIDMMTEAIANASKRGVASLVISQDAAWRRRLAGREFLLEDGQLRECKP